MNKMSWAMDAIAHEVRQLVVDFPQGNGILVIIPHAKLIPQLNRVLSSFAPQAQISTLPILTESVPLTARVMGDFERQQMVYDALTQNQWFEERYRWNFAQEAVRLMDELSVYGVIWPTDEKQLTQTLAEAYQSSVSQPLTFEARVIHSLWQILHDSTDQLSSTMAYLERLQRLPQLSIAKALVVVENSLRYPAERRCIEDFSNNTLVRRAAVTNLQPSTIWRWLNLLWMPDNPSALLDWCHQQKNTFKESPLKERIKIAACHYFEEEVQVAIDWIKQNITQNNLPIMVVAQDRQSARRLQACLTSSGISFEDSTGWVFSTTTVAGSLRVCLNLMQRGITRQGLFELFQTPWFLSAYPTEQRLKLIESIKHTIGDFSNQTQLTQWLNQSGDNQDEEVSVSIQHVKSILLEARALFQIRQHSLSGWLQKLFELLNLWLMTDALNKDLAGKQLIDLLYQLSLNHQHQKGSYTLSQWLRWLETVFENHYFRQENNEAQVIFTQLSQCLYLKSAATLVLGVDSSQLPYIPKNALFGDAVRASFKLPVKEDYVKQSIQDLIELIEHAESVLFTYRTEVLGAKTHLSPMLDILENTHRYMFNESLIVKPQSINLTHSQATCKPPKVIIPSHRLPKRVTSSFYQRMLNCPYQAFLYDILELKKPFPREEGVTKAEFGQLVHQVLQDVIELKRRNTQISWLDCIEEATNRRWSTVLEADPYWRAWLVYWRSLIEEIAIWFAQREHDKWQTIGCEQWFTKQKVDQQSQPLEIAGSIDRVDRRDIDGSEQVEILDYKLRSSKQITKKDIELGEEVQLPFYTQLIDEFTVNASYVFLEDTPIKVVSVNNLTELSELIIERWFVILNDTKSGIAWPANGDSQTCQRCQYQGICRRQYW
ncbi:MAG: PD-(D/E)XK nuclease family protein [Betaproteobacteria bacterium]|nr:PD-(D/E)XK nuclease family protein [Betaproteobacteria bacterium]